MKNEKLTLDELRKKFPRTRESFGFGMSHFPRDWKGTLGEYELRALLTNGEQLCVWLTVQTRGFDCGAKGAFATGDMAVFYITPAEIAELAPECRDWLKEGLKACETDVHGKKLAVHPDLLATDE